MRSDKRPRKPTTSFDSNNGKKLKNKGERKEKGKERRTIIVGGFFTVL
jgi:hypothetical protein